MSKLLYVILLLQIAILLILFILFTTLSEWFENLARFCWENKIHQEVTNSSVDPDKEIPTDSWIPRVVFPD